MYVCMYVCMYGDGGDFTWCVCYIISISVSVSVSIAIIANLLSARIPTFITANSKCPCLTLSFLA